MINNSNNNLNQSLAASFINKRTGKPWYGKNFDKILSANGLNHDCLKILAHVVVWIKFVNDHLKGIRKTIELNSLDDWPPVDPQNQDLVNEFHNVYDQFVEAILGFNPEQWNDKPDGATYTYRELVEGVLDHNLYHMGQIAWISKQK